MTKVELAKRLGITPQKLIRLLNRSSVVKPDDAKRYEEAIGVPRQIWWDSTKKELKDAIENAIGEKINNKTGRPIGK